MTRPLLALFLVLCGCAAWTPAARGLRYAPLDAPVPVVSDVVAAELPPESYAIGSLPAHGADPEAIQAELARVGARRGAHVVLLEKQEAIVARWTRMRTGDGVGAGETGRQETISIDSATIRALGVGYRHPTWCLGARLVCEPEPEPTRDSATCAVRVRGQVPDGPAERAGLGEGERVVQIDGRDVASPSDVSRWVDAARGAVRLLVVNARSAREIEITPAPCATLYPDRGAAGR